ncbi:XRE family transcriptional regulator [Erysipelothrix rhusiopathiae SY1027]|uniref:helix-turn-helix domain-containing protein n=1 Tax=Erysipelothrix rhusiopathiae TaxID=1648 RepID=UPI0003348DCB|nr:helix-turn-helix transcriptional regulator [Erysipelothrix rhusiopathiae]AGN25143.1 XRE family transcriptional regulator [Erysipelothrix rhusiopathiae SY1027]
MLDANLKKIRLKRKLTQRELAKRVNYSQQAVAKWEVGISNPDISNLVKICEELNISVECLLCQKPKHMQEFDEWSLHLAFYHVLNLCATHHEIGLNIRELDEENKLDLLMTW